MTYYRYPTPKLTENEWYLLFVLLEMYTSHEMREIRGKIYDYLKLRDHPAVSHDTDS